MSLIAGVQLVSLWAAIASVWAMYCVNETGSERMRVFAAIRFRPMTGGAVLLELERVTFKRHMRAVLLLRNPWALYDPIVLDAIKNPRSEFIAGVVGGEGEPAGAPPSLH